MKANNTLFNHFSARKTRNSTLNKEGLSSAKATLKSTQKIQTITSKPEELIEQYKTTQQKKRKTIPIINKKNESNSPKKQIKKDPINTQKTMKMIVEQEENSSKKSEQISENQEQQQQKQEQLQQQQEKKEEEKIQKKTAKKGGKKQQKQNKKKSELLQKINNEIAISNSNKLKNPTELQKKTEKILNEPSIKHKYEELTQEQTELLLPPDYKDILIFFTLLDQTLEFFTERGRIGYIDQIAEEISQVHKRTFSLEMLRQIIYLCPSLYKFEYSFNEKKRKSQLELSFQDNKIDVIQRKTSLKNALIQVTQQQHLEYLKQDNNEGYAEMVKNTWHPGFNLYNVSKIQLADIPKQPRSIHATSLYSTQQNGQNTNNNNVKNSIAQEIFQNMTKKEEIKKEKQNRLLEEAKKIKSEQAGNSLGVSDSLYKMIQAKRKMKEEEDLKKQQLSDANGKMEEVSLMKKVLGVLSVYYKIRNVSSMALVQVLQQIKTSQDFQFMTNQQIEEILKKISEKEPKLLTFKKNIMLGGNCLIFNKNMDLSIVYKNLEQQEQN